MLLGGAELNYGLFTFDHKRVTLDSRVRAGVGYVPLLRCRIHPAFGTGQAGAGGVTLPFLALSGTADPIAPPTSFAPHSIGWQVRAARCF
jgi:hypothetical protein